ncbi:unnamed protein product [Closterium sp. NIES-65]|nr:unnamed protein product [Closterium sp. NIES-65]
MATSTPTWGPLTSAKPAKSFSSAHSLSPPLKIRTAPLSLSQSRGRINPIVASTGNGAPASRAAKLVDGRVQEGPDLSVEVNGLRLPNPFVIASGPPGTNYVVMKKAFDEGWGGVICKTSRPLPRLVVVNVTPRYAKLRAFLNRFRFPSPAFPRAPPSRQLSLDSSEAVNVTPRYAKLRFPHCFPLASLPQRTPLSAPCAALPRLLQGGERHPALREAARPTHPLPFISLSVAMSARPPFPVSLSPPVAQLSLDSSKVVNVTPRYAKLRAPHSRDVIGWQNIELISDRPFEVMLAELKQLKAEYPDRVLIASIMEEFNKDAWEEIIGRCEEVGVLKAEYFDRVLIASIMEEFNKDAWEEIIGRCEEVGVDAFEINFSCPHGMPERRMGMAMGQDCELLHEVCGWINAAAHIPVWAKMTPNITDITQPARVALEAGCEGVSAINTITSVMEVNLKTLRPEPCVEGPESSSSRSPCGKMNQPLHFLVLSLSIPPVLKSHLPTPPHSYTTPGGYSSKAVRPIALAHVMKIARMEAEKFPGQGKSLSGIGGVETGENAAEFILLGADTVQVCTGVMLHGYGLVKSLCGGLQGFMEQHGFTSISDFKGSCMSPSFLPNPPSPSLSPPPLFPISTSTPCVESIPRPLAAQWHTRHTGLVQWQRDFRCLNPTNPPLLPLIPPSPNAPPSPGTHCSTSQHTRTWHSLQYFTTHTDLVRRQGHSLQYFTTHTDLVRRQREAVEQRNAAKRGLASDKEWTGDGFVQETETMVSN